MEYNRKDADIVGYGGSDTTILEEVLVNLAATVFNRNTLTTLTATNTRLTAEFSIAKNRVEVLTADEMVLKAEVDRLEGVANTRGISGWSGIIFTNEALTKGA